MHKYNLLKTLHIAASDFLGSGMEAEVYRYSDDKVFKLYNNMSDVNKQVTLKAFYSGLNATKLEFELPFIYEVNSENETLSTIEKLIQGKNMEHMLGEMDSHKQTKLMKAYLQANLALKSVEKPAGMEGFSLFDNLAPSNKATCWYNLLQTMISNKQLELGPYFQKNISHYNEKLHQIYDILSEGYSGEYAIIHGDFYPGNVLVDADLTVTGIIDFGMLTMYGDYLFDIAIGWRCFDMYNELDNDLNERYLDIIISTLGEEVRAKLYLYVLIYSFITANFYSKYCEDGHYKWCVHNLNNEDYWSAL